MTVRQMQLGPGSFSVGETGSLTQFQSQVTKISLVPSVNTDDDIPVLSGETVPGDRTESWVISGEILQDFGQAPVDGVSLSEWTFTNRGKVMPFDYVPNSSGDKGFSGDLVVEATEIGGDVKKKNTAEFEFRIVGEPLLVANEAG